MIKTNIAAGTMNQEEPGSKSQDNIVCNTLAFTFLS
jgi:hypothetical protein